MEIDAGGPQLAASLLEPFFNHDAAAGQLGPRPLHDLHQTLESLAPGEEIVDDQHMVLRAQELGRHLHIKLGAPGKGHHRSGVQLPVQVFGFGLFGEHHRQIAEILGGDGGNSDAAGLDGEDLVDAPVGEQAAEFLADLLQKPDVHLVVQKAVHLQNISFLNHAVGQDTLFQQFHPLTGSFPCRAVKTAPVFLIIVAWFLPDYKTETPPPRQFSTPCAAVPDGVQCKCDRRPFCGLPNATPPAVSGEREEFFAKTV